MVGGAGSLAMAPGVRVIDAPQFPADVKPESSAAIEALQVFRHGRSDAVQACAHYALQQGIGERRLAVRLGFDPVRTATRIGKAAQGEAAPASGQKAEEKVAG